MTVRSELEKATKLKNKKGEGLAAFKLRLIEAIDGLAEGDYDAIPKSAREWADGAIEAYNESRKLKDLPEFPEDLEKSEDEPDLEEASETAVEDEVGAEAEDEAEEADNEADEADSDAEQTEVEVTHTDVSENTGRRYKSRAKTKAKAAPAKAKKTAPAKTKKGDNGGSGKGLDFARKLLIKNMTMTAEELRDKVKAAGYEVSDSTLSTGASGFRAAVRALQNAGKLKSNLLD
jgi:hypothetical protein